MHANFDTLAVKFTIFDVLLLLGIAQGIITGSLLLTSKKNQPSNTFLALALFSFTLLTTKPLLHTLSLWNTSFFGYFPNALELAVAPLLYFYVKSLFEPYFKFKRTYWLHFVPYFLSQAYSFYIYFTLHNIQNIVLKNQIASSLYFNEVKQLDEYILLIFSLYYLYKSVFILRNYKQWRNSYTSDASLPEFNWLKSLFILFFITTFILLISRILSFLSLIDILFLGDYLWQFLSLYIAFLIYYMGLKGYLQPNYAFTMANTSFEEEKSEQLINFDHLKPKIIYAMESERLYLNSQLTLHGLASHLKSSSKEISGAINSLFEVNFRDFINTYRVKDVKVKLNDPAYSHMSISGIAMESGFNSEASFYRIFKKYMGLTPKEYIKKISKRS